MTALSAASMAAQAAGRLQQSPPPRSVDGFTDGDLIDEVTRRWAELENDVASDLVAKVIDDVGALEEAADWWRRGDRREALHYLEIALGRDFDGLGDLRPEDLR